MMMLVGEGNRKRMRNALVAFLAAACSSHLIGSSPVQGSVAGKRKRKLARGN